MTEGLFILTTIFVAYVVYVIASEQKAEEKKIDVVRPEPAVAAVAPKKEAVAAQVSVQPVPVKPAPAAKAAAKPAPVKAEKPAAKPKKAAAKPVVPEVAPAPVVTATSAKNGLKDPVSGDIATSYSNYRFTKRWIKDALVAEGLLPKVYKNTELDSVTEAQIKTAIQKLEAIVKYHA